MDNLEDAGIEIRDSHGTLTLSDFRFVSSDLGNLLGWNAVKVRIGATLPGFTARFVQEINLWELREFYDALLRLNCNLRGEASFEDLERAINIKVAIDTLGHLAWEIELSHPATYCEARLRFEIENDQSYLPAILRQFEAVFEQCQ